MSFEYITKINNRDISGVQLKRVELQSEAGFISSYNLNFNSIEFTVPYAQSSVFYDTTPQNKVSVFEASSGKQIFIGYVTTKEDDDNSLTIKAKAQGYLSQLSKKYITLADTGYMDARAYLYQVFQRDLLPILPYNYTINTHTINDNLLSGIALYTNTGKSGVTGMSLAVDLMTTLNTSAYLEDGVLNFAAFPESWPDINSLVDIGPFLDKKIVAKEQYQYYYDTVSLDYYNVPNGPKKNITIGPGGLIKKPTLNNTFIDDISAQNLVQRYYNIYSKIYSAVEFNCSRDVELKLCDIIGYKNPQYRNYAFFITSLKNNYTSWAVKALGIKI
jgi:hypothetical protein